MNEKINILGARYCRIAVIQNFVNAGILDNENALLHLRGRLDPDDPSSIVDDSSLLNNLEEILKMKTELLSKIKEVDPEFSVENLDTGILKETFNILERAIGRYNAILFSFRTI